MTFSKEVEKQANVKLTENGAIALESTGNDLVDLFSVIGALRSRPEDVANKFINAFNEDKLLATKLLFYTRNIRNGLGERDIARIMLYTLANKEPEIVIKNLELIPYFGRWDDLFVLFDTPVQTYMIEYVKNTLSQDIIHMNNNENISLLAKWMPSINTSSKKTRLLAKRLIKFLNFKNDCEYRKTLSKLRKYLDITETHISREDFKEIDYSKVPSLAMNRYRYIFESKDYTNFKSYLKDVKEGKKKINSSTLYPYNITEKILNQYNISNIEEDVLNEQWKALPNYIEDDDNYLVMADVSGSMTGRPMATSIGLAIYFAERNHGDFSGKYMTFSEKPKIISIKKNTSIVDKVKYVENTDIGYNTDLESAFNCVLNTAIRTNCKQEDLPKSIIVITDMEIDDWQLGENAGNLTFLDEMKERFENEGYKLPNLVFWNVDSRQDTFHASSDNKNVQLVSGQSISTFNLLMDSFNLTPYEMMLKALNNSIYDVVKI